MKNNQQLKEEAYASLSGVWAPAVILTIVFSVCATGVIPVLGAIFISPVIIWGYSAVILRFARGGEEKPFDIVRLFDGFKEDYLRIWGTMFLQNIYIALWSCLFVIPGIIKGLSYALTPFILADTDLKYNEAIDRSIKLMDGHKLDLFWLLLSFIGWFLLSTITCGLASFFVTPYVYTAFAKFYLERLEEEKAQGGN